MQVQKINNQASFGARNVIIDRGISDLGEKTVKHVSEVLPNLLKLGDKETDLIILRNINPDNGEFSLHIDAKKEIQIITKNALGRFNFKNTLVKGYRSALETKSGNDVFEMAAHAVEELNANVQELREKALRQQQAK